jgi:ribosomal protein L11 methylase PrmA
MTLGSPEPQPLGWCYRLAPELVLRSRPCPPGADSQAQVLLVESGGAFPVSHPTTRLCLDLLREALAAAPAANLLDVGCGSGILGLAAAALQVPQVVGVDVALPAVLATRENARENGLAGALQIVQGSTECLRATFDLVAANLPWEVQVAKVAEFCRLGSPGGRLILSGFRDLQEPELQESYRQQNWSLKRRLSKDFSHPELPRHISFTWVAWLLGKEA